MMVNIGPHWSTLVHIDQHFSILVHIEKLLHNFVYILKHFYFWSTFGPCLDHFDPLSFNSVNFCHLHSLSDIMMQRSFGILPDISV